jgi:nucleotide-binding universal stress UspA family protein
VLPEWASGVGCGYLDFKRSVTMIGTILCGVNDSQSARNALQLAAALSDRLRARLVVVHVASGESIDEAERLVSRLMHEAAPARHADPRVAAGDRAARLAQIAAEEGADLIIVGSGGNGRLRLRPGSGLAGELESATACPVLLAPPQTRPRSELRLARAARATAS